MSSFVPRGKYRQHFGNKIQRWHSQPFWNWSSRWYTKEECKGSWWAILHMYKWVGITKHIRMKPKGWSNLTIWYPWEREKWLERWLWESLFRGHAIRKGMRRSRKEWEHLQIAHMWVGWKEEWEPWSDKRESTKMTSLEWSWAKWKIQCLRQFPEWLN